MKATQRQIFLKNDCQSFLKKQGSSVKVKLMIQAKQRVITVLIGESKADVNYALNVLKQLTIVSLIHTTIQRPKFKTYWFCIIDFE